LSFSNDQTERIGRHPEIFIDAGLAYRLWRLILPGIQRQGFVAILLERRIDAAIVVGDRKSRVV